MDTPPCITVYSFRYRDSRTGKWRDARYKITPEDARANYGEGNYELLQAHTYQDCGSTSAFLNGIQRLR